VPPAPPRLAALPSSPSTCRVLGRHSLGYRTGSEVMRQASPSSSTFHSKVAGRLSPTGKHSVCVQGLQMLMGFIHNRQHINRAKIMPRQGRLSGHLMRHLSGTKKGISVTKTYVPAARISVTGVTFLHSKDRPVDNLVDWLQGHGGLVPGCSTTEEPRPNICVKTRRAGQTWLLMSARTPLSLR
jgi:hypothetical protein